MTRTRDEDAMPESTLILGDCLDVLRTLETGSADAVVTDPPAGIAFMNKSWDKNKGGRSAWVAWLAERLAEAMRVARPGARMLCWALPRTSHWTGCAVEDAGWIVEDIVTHLFGQGFPKGKSKLKPACEFWYLARKPGKGVPDLNVEDCRIGTLDNLGGGDQSGRIKGKADGWDRPWMHDPAARAAHAARHNENVAKAETLGRWPANLCLSHVGGPDGCREVGTKRVKSQNPAYASDGKGSSGMFHASRPAGKGIGHADPDGLETVAAWECVEGCPVAELDRMSGERRPGWFSNKARRGLGYMGADSEAKGSGSTPIGDSGGASRFFATFGYFPKASRRDRGEGNTHPTVKSTDLMRWLIRLISRPGDVILDPFMGSGSTGVACVAEGRAFVGIDDDSEPGAFATAERRVAAARAEAAVA